MPPVAEDLIERADGLPAQPGQKLDGGLLDQRVFGVGCVASWRTITAHFRLPPRSSVRPSGYLHSNRTAWLVGPVPPSSACTGDVRKARWSLVKRQRDLGSTTSQDTPSLAGCTPGLLTYRGTVLGLCVVTSGTVEHNHARPRCITACRVWHVRSVADSAGLWTAASASCRHIEEAATCR